MFAEFMEMWNQGKGWFKTEWKNILIETHNFIEILFGCYFSAQKY